MPVRNRRDALLTLIGALKRQTIPRSEFEVLIADDGSDDGCTDGLATADGWIRVLRGPASNAYAARNRAARAARAPLLAACDSDCIPEPDWLEHGIRALEAADVVGGLIRFVVPERRTIWTLMDIETFIDQQSVVESGGALGGNVFFRAELFERVGGFDSTLPNGGDQEIVHRCTAAGGRLEFASEAVVWHPARSTARAFLRKCWDVHRRYAVRESRAGRRPYATRLRWWVPLFPTIRSRRRFGRTLRLDRRRLGANGIRPTLREDAAGLILIYAVLPVLSGVAQFAGWYEGTRPRRTNSFVPESAEPATGAGELPA